MRKPPWSKALKSEGSRRPPGWRNLFAPLDFSGLGFLGVSGLRSLRCVEIYPPVSQGRRVLRAPRTPTPSVHNKC